MQPPESGGGTPTPPGDPEPPDKPEDPGILAPWPPRPPLTIGELYDRNRRRWFWQGAVE